jgi:UDP-MurNAc hydroxylase
VIETPDVTVLCDPWFTEGIYDGSWFHFPRVDDPLKVIGDVDYIYISHIHPDHYDPDFLREYEKNFGRKKILVAQRNFPYLERALTSSGFDVDASGEVIRLGETSLRMIPIRPDDPNEIDSALFVEFKDKSGRRHTVLNVNDIVFDDFVLADLARQYSQPDILLLGYTGAGAYPQTYFGLDDPQLPVEAENKKQAFFARYARNAEAFRATVNLPFAGKYILGGARVGLNEYRGVADAVEILDFDARAIVLGDLGGAISTADLKPTSTRTTVYDRSQFLQRCQELSEARMAYELIDEKLIPLIPFEQLLRKAHIRAKSKSVVEEDYYFVIHLPDGRAVEMNANRQAIEDVRVLPDGDTSRTPRSEILMDPRYLFGLLVGLFHWNTAEVGSQYDVRRIPNQFRREAQHFLNFLSV